jgi:hypothetical protein
MKMRCFIVVVLAAAVVFTAALALPVSVAAQGARLKLDLGDLAARATEEVNISVDKSTLEWAIQAVDSKGGDAEKLRELMKELEAITVQVMEFKGEKTPSWDELMQAAGGVMKQIEGPQWKPIVSVTGKEEGKPEFVRISLFNDSAGEVGGLAVLVLEPTEVVLVNMVGKVRLDQLGTLGQIMGKQGMFGFPDSKPAPSGQPAPQKGQPESQTEQESE